MSFLFSQMEPHSDVEEELEPADSSFLDVSLTEVVDTSFAWTAATGLVKYKHTDRQTDRPTDRHTQTQV